MEVEWHHFDCWLRNWTNMKSVCTAINENEYSICLQCHWTYRYQFMLTQHKNKAAMKVRIIYCTIWHHLMATVLNTYNPNIVYTRFIIDMNKNDGNNQFSCVKNYYICKNVFIKIQIECLWAPSSSFRRSHSVGSRLLFLLLFGYSFNKYFFHLFTHKLKGESYLIHLSSLHRLASFWLAKLRICPRIKRSDNNIDNFLLSSFLPRKKKQYTFPMNEDQTATTATAIRSK